MIAKVAAMPITYYEILEVSPSASQTVISAAYRTLSQKYHPDKNNGDKHCEEMMAQINVAFGVLSDPIKRKVYDEELGNKQNHKPAQQTSPTKQEVKEPQTEKIEQNNSDSGKQIVYAATFALVAFLVIVIAKYSDNQNNNYQQIESKYKAEENAKNYKWTSAEGFLTGNGSAQNFQKAKTLYEELAEAKSFYDNRAEQRLAEIYYFGLGQQKDYIKALGLYQKIGYAETNFMTGMIYFQGLGVQKDLIKAYHYFNLAQAVQFDIRKEEYKPNPLVQEEQNKLMYENKEEKEKAFHAYLSTSKSYFASAAKLKKDFLDKKLSVDEINKAQNLKIED